MPRILIVDDEETLAKFIEKIVSELSEDALVGEVETKIATTGNDGIKAAEEFMPDVVLLDIKLPDISGIEVLSRLKEMDEDVQVIMMTGFASLETAVAAVREGAYDYINKPFESDEQLKNIVKNALERRDLIRERKTLLAELAEANEKLEEANKILQEKKALVDKELEEKIEQLARLNEFTRKLSQELDLKSLLDLIPEEGAKVLNAKGFALFLREKEKNEVVAKKVYGEIGIKVGDKIKSIPNKAKIDGNLIWAPLSTHKGTLGAIAVAMEEPKEKDLDPVSILASSIAIAINNARLFDTLRRSYIESILSLLLIQESKDPKIKEHSFRVAEYAALTAEEMGLSEEDARLLRYAGLLHDIGKVLEEKIEFPIVAEKVASPMRWLERARPILRHQAERYDGKGYPDGLSGEDIPLGARIIAVANAYVEDIESGMSREDALRHLEEEKGKAFDPQVVEVFKKVAGRK